MASFADRFISALRRAFGAVERRLPGEPEPLLDNPKRGCPPGCTVMRVVEGCPTHDRKQP